MPVFLNNSTDQEVTWDGSPNFAGGQVSKPRANTLEASQACLLQNMDTDIYGHLTTRRGIKQIGDDLNETIQGIADYLTPDRHELIVAAGGVLRAFNGAVWSLAGGVFNLISAYTPAIFVQGVDILYIAQSDSALSYYRNGAVNQYPDAAVSEITKIVTTGADPMNLGNTHFTIEDEDGQVCVWFNYNSTGTDPLIGDRSIPVYLNPGDTPTQIATAIATALEADAKFTASSSSTEVAITCVAAGARADVIAANSTLTVSVTTQGKDQNNNPPVGITSLCWHTDALFAAGVAGFPDTVYRSQFLDGSVWDRANWSFRVGAGEGDPITGLVPWTNYNLIVLKRHSIWVVNCNPTQQPTAFQINRIHKNIGCVAPRTARQVGSDIFLLTTSGVRTINNIITSEQQKEVGPALSEPIGDYIDRINPTAVSKSCAFHWGNRYILFAPLDNATTPDTAFPFSTNNNAWIGVWTGWHPTYVSERVDGDIHKMWFGQSDGTVVEFMDYVRLDQETAEAFLDQGESIPSTVLSKAYIWNEIVSPKTGFNARIEFCDSVADVIGTVFRDQGTEEVWESFSTSAGNELILPFVLPATLPAASGVIPLSYDIQRYQQFSEFQMKLATPGGKLVLCSIAASAFIETFKIQS